MLLAFAIIAPLAASLLAGFITHRFSRFAPLALAAIPALLFAGFAGQIGAIGFGSTQAISLPWVPSLDTSIDLRLDGIGLIYALMITGIGSFIFLYAGGYLPQDPRERGRFYTYISLFMTGMLGLVLSDNIILLFIFWELTSISSYLLIGFNNESAEARRKALQALLVTGSGGVALLAGLILLGTVAGTYRLSEIVAQGSDLSSAPLAAAALPFILLGAFTKSAQFPFHFWLPNAMAAPTPVSAYLHSATMVKAGIFLLFKLYPVYGTTALWTTVLPLCGAATLLLGAITGLFQRDLKRILAFTTMAVLGILVMLIGVGGELALKSALLFMIGHALYKATLFMTAGNIDHATGTRDVRILGGLRTIMPLTALAAGLAALSKGGFPPMIGFLGKEYVYKASSSLAGAAPLITLIALLGNALLLALAFKAGIHPYWAKPNAIENGKPYSRFLPYTPHEANTFMVAGPLVLTGLSLAIGLFPQLLSNSLIAPALSETIGRPAPVALSLWHGFSLPLLLSACTVALGLTVYAVREKLWKNESVAGKIAERDTENIYNYAFAQFVAQSKRITYSIQNGSLRFYLWTIIVAAGSLVVYKLLALDSIPYQLSFDNINVFHLAMGLSMLVAIAYAAFAKTLFKALAGLGLVGYGIAILFAINGAPDLAITQVIVETLAVALLLFASLKLPHFRQLSSTRTRLLDTSLAIMCGIVATAMALKATQVQLSPAISNTLANWSYELAKGKNVVNVILVDFRALDTFGEIAVLGIAAIGISICLPRSGLAYGSSDLLEGKSRSLILSVGAKLLLPTCFIFSLLALYRGHNEPGGGFIGGLILAAGIVLYAFAMGTNQARAKLKLPGLSWVAIGLIVALCSALMGPLAGQAFMSGLWLPAFTLPVLGNIHLGTPLIFDIGVYCVVLGFATQTAFSFLDASVAECPTQSKIDKSGKRQATLSAR